MVLWDLAEEQGCINARARAGARNTAVTAGGEDAAAAGAGGGEWPVVRHRCVHVWKGRPESLDPRLCWYGSCLVARIG